MEIYGLEKIRWFDSWSQKTSTRWRNKLLWWVATLETLRKSHKDTLSGKEKFLRLSQPLHFTRGGEDSHGGQGEHRTETWSTLVQVNVDKLCIIHIKQLFNWNVSPLYSFDSRLRKKRAEVTSMAPTFAEDNLRHLAHNVSWEKWNIRLHWKIISQN